LALLPSVLELEVARLSAPRPVVVPEPLPARPPLVPLRLLPVPL
jgi:hypothetical protein